MESIASVESIKELMVLWNRNYYEIFVLESANGSIQGKKNFKSLKIRLDLAQRRASLLSKAISVVKDNPKVDFAFANINCRLAIRLEDGNLRYFNSEKDLIAAIQSIEKN